jgi:hypothetical protein
VKRLTVREIFKQAPDVKHKLWGGEYLPDGTISAQWDDREVKIRTGYSRRNKERKINITTYMVSNLIYLNKIGYLPAI